jgi:hypothetical protein
MRGLMAVGHMVDVLIRGSGPAVVRLLMLIVLVVRVVVVA